MFIAFKIIDKTIGLRVPAQVEIDGLDVHEHGLTSAYSGFAITDVTDMDVSPNDNTELGEDDYEKASDAQINAAVKVTREAPLVPSLDTGIHKVSIICRLSKFDALKKALNELGVTGMTMYQVMGSGIERGSTERYRGAVVGGRCRIDPGRQGHRNSQEGPLHRPHRRWQDLRLQCRESR